MDRLLDKSRRHEQHDDGCMKIMSLADVLWRMSGAVVAGFVSCGSSLHSTRWRRLESIVGD